MWLFTIISCPWKLLGAAEPLSTWSAMLRGQWPATMTLFSRRKASSSTEAPVDVSFIGLQKILPAVRNAAPQAEVVALFKPQFEVGRVEVGKGGIVRNPTAIEEAVISFRRWCAANGYAVKAEAASEVAGAEGNREIFFHLLPEGA